MYRGSDAFGHEGLIRNRPYNVQERHQQRYSQKAKATRAAAATAAVTAATVVAVAATLFISSHCYFHACSYSGSHSQY